MLSGMNTKQNKSKVEVIILLCYPKLMKLVGGELYKGSRVMPLLQILINS